MARIKRTSVGLAKARQRCTALASIGPNLDLGQGFTATVIQNQINDAQARLDTYNRLLSQLDGLQNDVMADEKKMRDLAVRILAAVAVRYGRDSNEYEMVGGTRQSERKGHNGNGHTPADPGAIQQPVIAVAQ